MTKKTTPARLDDETTAKALLSILKKAGFTPRFDETGGGCGTIFVPTASGKHQVMVGPFDYFAPGTPNANADISIGVESTDPEVWGDGTLGASFRTEEEFLYKVKALVDSPDPMSLGADDLDAAFLANFGMPKK